MRKKSYAKCENIKLNVKKITLNVKNDRSGKKISTLNVKSVRSGKCEQNLNAKCEKKFGQSDSQFGKFCRPGQFFSGFWVSTFQKLKFLGSVMILREKCKILTQEWAGGIFLGFFM